MTQQEIFDTGLNHLREQGEASVHMHRHHGDAAQRK